MALAAMRILFKVPEIVEFVEESCRDVNTLANLSAKCAFVDDSELCSYDGLVFSYTKLTFCDLEASLAKVLPILALCLFIYFLTISIVADDFLCPSLLTMSKTLRMPDNIAGVTFLAFGNGAPDIFSSIGGISHAKSSLIFSSLYGGGIFVTTVVTGSVLLTGDFSVMKRPIIRDIIFYIVASFLVWLFIFYENITIYHSISLVGFYILYIAVLAVSRYFYLRGSNNNETNIVINSEEERNNNEVISDQEGDDRSMKSNKSNLAPSLPGSRKNSIVSSISLRMVPEDRPRLTSYDDEIILTRFYRRGTLKTSRRKKSKVYVAHHHHENSLNHISKMYENERRQGLVNDVRYKDMIGSQQITSNVVRLDNSKRHVNEIKFTNNFGKPKYLQQLSRSSVFSMSSSETFLNMLGSTKELLLHICPIDYLEWHNYSWHKKIMECIKALPYLIMTVCIPVVDLESPKENWCLPLICINIILAPQSIIFFLQVEQNISVIPLWLICLIISVILSVIVLLTSNSKEPPIYNRVFGFIGFLISVIFINSTVNEVISILETLGIIFNLSDSILGLTILAWGNSLGDIISDLSMARHGYPGMAIAACFGSPMLNLLMGLGIPYTLLFAKGEKTSIDVKHTSMIILLYTTLTAALCISLMTFILKRFRSSKIHGFVLIGIYFLHVVLALLIEFHVIEKNHKR